MSTNRPMSSDLYRSYFKPQILQKWVESKEEKDNKGSAEKKKTQVAPTDDELQKKYLKSFYKTEPLYYEDIADGHSANTIICSDQINKLMDRLKLEHGKQKIYETVEKRCGRKLDPLEKQRLYVVYEKFLDEKNSSTKLNSEEKEKKEENQIDDLYNELIKTSLDPVWDEMSKTYFDTVKSYSEQVAKRAYTVGKECLEGLVYECSKSPNINLITDTLNTLSDKIGVCGAGFATDLQDAYRKFIFSPDIMQCTDGAGKTSRSYFYKCNK